MDITVKTADLGPALDRAHRVAERKGTIPILAYLHAHAEGDTLTLTATDHEVGLRLKVPAVVTAAGATALPARKLHEIVRSLAMVGEITITSAGKESKITAGAYRGKLQAPSVEDFPTVAAPNGSAVMTVQKAGLRELVAKTRCALGTSDNRYTYACSLFEIDNEEARMVSTDGHRLALAAAKMPGLVGTGSQLIPRRTVEELASVLDGDGAVDFSTDDTHLFFATPERVLVSRTMDTAFPAYQRVIPKANDHHAIVDRALFESVLRRAILTAEAKASSALMEFAPDELTISTTSVESGESVEKVPATYAGPPISVRMNSRYVLDFFGAVGTPQIEIALKDEASAVVFTPVGGDVAYTYVVMPVRL